LGQGDPLLWVLFLIGSEPLNKLIATKLLEVMNVIREGVTEGSIKDLRILAMFRNKCSELACKFIGFFLPVDSPGMPIWSS
jgi:hypothetical protein